ncbi:hypothetical protein [Streptomyces sp. NPDC047046]|uniref:hypothetical protein n=1 Tax=Streptomyces sp. NPDC047046 TaxID=3155378 RepID=UPI0033CFC4A4
MAVLRQEKALREALGTDAAGVSRARRAYRRKEVPRDPEDRRLLAAYVRYYREEFVRPRRFLGLFGWGGVGFVLCVAGFLVAGRYGAALSLVGMYLVLALVSLGLRGRLRKSLAARERALAEAGRANG